MTRALGCALRVAVPVLVVAALVTLAALFVAPIGDDGDPPVVVLDAGDAAGARRAVKRLRDAGLDDAGLGTAAVGAADRTDGGAAGGVGYAVSDRPRLLATSGADRATVRLVEDVLDVRARPATAAGLADLGAPAGSQVVVLAAAP